MCFEHNGKERYPSWHAAAPARPAPVRPAPDVDVAVLEEEETEERLDEPWRVILYNDDIHSFDEVIFQLIKATGYTVEEAGRIVWQAHMRGKAVAYQGTFDECFRVQGVLCEIQLVTEIEG